MKILKLFASALAVLIVWVLLIGYGVINGWFTTPIATQDNAEAFFDAAQKLSRERHVADAAIAILENGELVGQHFFSKEQTIDEQTVFVAASLSKLITAYGTMKLVRQRRLDLDKPVEDYLSRWSLPASVYDNKQVTVRRLLSHTAGLTDGLGFGDYEAGESLPPLEQSLRNPRASSGSVVEIKVGAPPGQKWQYSGGGYLILQLLIEEVSGRDFADHMQQSVFEPLEMSCSSYEFVGTRPNIAKPYDRSGIEREYFKVAAVGSSGLSTCLSDMVKFVRAIQTATGLDKATIEQMQEPHGRKYGADIWGLGTMLYTPTQSGRYVFGHDGQNEPALNATVRINPDNQDAIIVLSSGGSMVATSIGYEWVVWQTGLPDFLGIGDEFRRAFPFAVLGYLLILLLLWWFLRLSKRSAKE